MNFFNEDKYSFTEVFIKLKIDDNGGTHYIHLGKNDQIAAIMLIGKNEKRIFVSAESDYTGNMVYEFDEHKHHLELIETGEIPPIIIPSIYVFNDVSVLIMDNRHQLLC